LVGGQGNFFVVSPLMKRKLNKKFCIWLLAGTILVGGAIHGVHVLQARHTASGLLRLADKAEKEKDDRKAGDYLYWYLRLVPDDTDVLLRYGQLLHKQAEASKNYKLFEHTMLVFDQVLRLDKKQQMLNKKALGLLGASTAGFLGSSFSPGPILAVSALYPGRAEPAKNLRETVVDIAMRMRRYSDARVHLEELLSPEQAKEKEQLKEQEQLQLKLSTEQLSEAQRQQLLTELTLSDHRLKETRIRIGECFAKIGKCLEAEKRFHGDDGAVAYYSKAIDKSPARIEIYVLRAAILWRHPDQGVTKDSDTNDPADDIMNAMVSYAQNELVLPVLDASTLAILGSPFSHGALLSISTLYPGRSDEFNQALRMSEDEIAADARLPAKAAKNRVDAYLARAGYLRERSEAEIAPAKRKERLYRAGADLQLARQSAPHSADMHLECAEWWIAQSKIAEVSLTTFCYENARQELAKGLELHRSDRRMYLVRSRLEMAAGKLDKAIQFLRDGLLEVRDDQTELQLTLADLLIQNHSNFLNRLGFDGLREPRLLVARLRAKVPSSALPSPAPLDFLDVFALMKESQKDESWLKTADKLDNVRSLLTSWPALAARANFMLGYCYEKLADSDQQLLAYRRALSNDPASFEATAGMCRAYLAMGKLDAAIDLVRRYPLNTPELKITLAQLLVQRNRNLPKAQQDWDEVAALTKEAADAKSLTPETFAAIQLLNAELIAQKNPERAVEFLQNIAEAAKQEKRPKLDYWLARATIVRRNPSGAEEALRILNAAQKEKEFGDCADLRLARAWPIIELGGKEAPGELNKLSANIEVFNIDDQRRLLWELSKILTWIGELKEAKKLLVRLDALQPNDLSIKMALFDLAIDLGEITNAEKLVAKIKDLERENGTRWRFAKASILIKKAKITIDSIAGSAKGGDKRRQEEANKTLQEAEDLLTAVRNQRPNWHRIHSSLGQIEELLGKQENAITVYDKAFSLGERNPSVVGRLLELTHGNERYRELRKSIFSNLPENYPLSDALWPMRVDDALRNGDFKNALELVEKAVTNNPNNFRHRILLAEVYLKLGGDERIAQAEAILRKAAEMAGNEPETWLALVKYLVFREKREAAEIEIEKAKVSLPAAKTKFVVAKSFEMMGKLEEAKSWYRAALLAQPEDLDSLQGAATVCLQLAFPRVRSTEGARADAKQEAKAYLEEAKAYLGRIIALKRISSRDKEQARQLLGQIIRDDSDYQESRAAIAKLGLLPSVDGSANAGKETIEEMSAKAAGLAMLQRRPDRLKAIQILEDLKKRQQQHLSSNDQFLLGQLYASVGNWRAGHSELMAVVRKEESNLVYLTVAARQLLRHDEVDDALWVFAKLKQYFPHAPATLEIEARALHAQGKGNAVAALLKQFAEKHPDQAASVTVLLEELKQIGAAEELYRAALAKSASPENTSALALFLGRQGRIDDALDLCEQLYKTGRVETAVGASLTVLFRAKPTRSQCERVADWLSIAMKQENKQENKAILFDYRGALYFLQEDYGGAKDAYRDALKHKANDLTALNNLAALLALQHTKLDEALELVQRAMAISGPGQPDLLDTRGLVYIAQGKGELAVKDLEAAVAEKSQAGQYFHLAQAYQLTKNGTSAARMAMADGKNVGLSLEGLHPLEREAYRQLCSQLGIGQ
jgi:tetratricopeptide (TPR) repeat protein